MTCPSRERIAAGSADERAGRVGLRHVGADRVAGSFFEAVLKRADAYLLENVLHDWDDERSTKILQNCRAAMQPAAGFRLGRVFETPTAMGIVEGIAI